MQRSGPSWINADGYHSVDGDRIPAGQAFNDSQ